MPKADHDLAPIVLLKLNPATGETDWSMYVGSPYELTGPIDTFRAEAAAKGLALIVTVGFITLDEFYGQEPEEEERND